MNILDIGSALKKAGDSYRRSAALATKVKIRTGLHLLIAINEGTTEESIIQNTYLSKGEVRKLKRLATDYLRENAIDQQTAINIISSQIMDLEAANV